MLGKVARKVSNEGRTVRDDESFGFLFLSFEPRSSFGDCSVSIGKKRRNWNDPRTRSERRGRLGKIGMISPFRMQIIRNRLKGGGGGSSENMLAS